MALQVSIKYDYCVDATHILSAPSTVPYDDYEPIGKLKGAGTLIYPQCAREHCVEINIRSTAEDTEYFIVGLELGLTS